VDSVIETERGDSLMVAGVNGTQVETNTSLLASINWLSEAASIILRKHKGRQLINASAQGAHIKGFEEMPLEAIIEVLPEFRAPWKLYDLIDGMPCPTAREIRADLKQMSTLITQVRHLVHKKLQSALVEMMNISRVSAFMKQLLAPALAGGHPGNILKNLSWADGIILKMLTSLDKHQKK
jgi:hypothetical protein